MNQNMLCLVPGRTTLSIPDLHSPAASKMMNKLTKSKFSMRNAWRIEQLEMVLWFHSAVIPCQFSGPLHLQGLIPPKDTCQWLTVPKIYVGSCFYMFLLSNPTLPLKVFYKDFLRQFFSTVYIQSLFTLRFKCLQVELDSDEIGLTPCLIYFNAICPVLGVGRKRVISH